GLLDHRAAVTEHDSRAQSTGSRAGEVEIARAADATAGEPYVFYRHETLHSRAVDPDVAWRSSNGWAQRSAEQVTRASRRKPAFFVEEPCDDTRRLTQPRRQVGYVAHRERTAEPVNTE